MITENTRRQLNYFIQNKIPIKDYNREKLYITEKIYNQELYETTIKMNEINSLECSRLWVKNNVEERRSPYDIFTAIIAVSEKYSINILCIQEKWIKRTDIKVVSADIDVIDIINKLKYEIIEINIDELENNINLNRMIDEEYKDWMLLNQNIHGLQILGEKIENKIDFYKEKSNEYRDKLSPMEKIIADNIKVKNNMNDMKEISEKYSLTYNAAFVKLYEAKAKNEKRRLKRYNKIMDELGE